MTGFPKTSPWGEVQHCEKMIDGVFLVSTASHGGIMVRKNAAAFLSPVAREIALNERNYLCFEEDCDEAIVMRELLDKRLWELPDRITDKAGYADAIDRSLVKWHPEYWDNRQKAISEQAGSTGDSNLEQMIDARMEEDIKTPTLSGRLEAGKAKAATHIPKASKQTPSKRYAEVG